MQEKSATVFAGSGSDNLPNVEKERGDTRLGEHHRAAKRPCCDEESGGGHNLHRCAGDSSSSRFSVFCISGHLADL